MILCIFLVMMSKVGHSISGFKRFLPMFILFVGCDSFELILNFVLYIESVISGCKIK